MFCGIFYYGSYFLLHPPNGKKEYFNKVRKKVLYIPTKKDMIGLVQNKKEYYYYGQPTSISSLEAYPSLVRLA